ncbi:hypothetical protein F5Y15DRAFT_259938 [Xylariaceae sp. FL0016]|nr:hypothetical protein F5Y15DRAFT_259938 [Xylariaceae sp. FL0016]
MLILKAQYASAMFFLLASALIKWSMSSLIHQLSPSTFHQALNWVLRILVGLWMMSSILMAAFQCALPAPWDYVDSKRCIDRQAAWSYVGVVDTISEVFIVAIFLLIIGKLQMSAPRKSVILLALSSRLLVVAAIVAQLLAFRDIIGSSDVTMDLWLPVALSQATLCASVVTACVPHLKPFMESLESGIVRVEYIAGSEEHLGYLTSRSNEHYLSSPSDLRACSSRDTTLEARTTAQSDRQET